MLDFLEYITQSKTANKLQIAKYYKNITLYLNAIGFVFNSLKPLMIGYVQKTNTNSSQCVLQTKVHKNHSFA